MAAPQNAVYGIQSTAGAVAVRNTKGKQFAPSLWFVVCTDVQHFPL